jgi:hypothetical protein
MPLIKKENKSGGHYMSGLEQGVPEIRAPPTLTWTSPYFRNSPMTYDKNISPSLHEDRDEQVTNCQMVLY